MDSTATRRAAVAGLLALGAAAAAPVPRRVVSIGACLDVILVHVADRAQIAAVSHFSQDPAQSVITELARTLPYTYETAEEVMSLNPDLVLASRRSGGQTRAALKRMGVPLEEFAVPETVAESLAQVRRIGGLVGRPARGEAVVDRIEAALAAAAPQPGEAPLSALIYQPDGFVAGPQTLVGELMVRCGYQNVAERFGVKKWGNVPLERLLADPPQVLLAGETAPGAPTWADRIIRHPALDHMAPRMRRAVFPQRLLYCAGPVLVETAAALSAARRSA